MTDQTANEVLLDEALRRMLRLRRYTRGEVSRMQALLSRSERDVLALLLLKLDGVTGRGIPKAGSFTAKRLEKLLDEIADMRSAAWKTVRKEFTEQLKELAKVEAANEHATLEDAVPIKLELARPAVGQVFAAATSRPFQGRLLKEWYSTLEATDKRRIKEAVRRGVVEGKKTDEIVRDIRGSKPLKRKKGTNDAPPAEDGAFGGSRRDLEAVVSTAVSHVTNAAREEVWEANADIIEGLRWTSTLDGRTSAICRARDGKIFKVGEGPRPPAHVRCRSVMVPVLDGVGVLGNRPTVTDTRTREEREVDFRAQAKKSGKSIQSLRDSWAKENVGSIPSETTYSEFLKRQSASFQDEVLGKTKGRLFRQGGLELDAFVDGSGNELTLDDLRKKQPDAWKKAFGDNPNPEQ